jgi:hypothetical protein
MMKYIQILLAIFSLSLVNIAHAQESLFSVLSSKQWKREVGDNRLFISVNPHSAKQSPENEMGHVSKYAPLPKDISFASLPQVASLFHQQFVRIGNILTIVPETQTLYTQQIEGGDPLADMSRGIKTNLLLSSLTSSQWSQLSGTQGLGLTNFNTLQGNIYQSLLPTPFAYRRGQQYPIVTLPPAEVLTLTDTEKNTVRLQIVRQTSLFFPTSGGGYMGKSAEKPEIYSLYGLQIQLVKDIDGLFGVTLKNKKPNIMKKNSLISDNANQEKTIVFDEKSNSQNSDIATILQKVSVVTKVRYIADSRLGKLPVFIRGNGSVTATNLLKSLALGVSGSYRKVGNIYLLTQDIEGWGIQTARMKKWARSMEIKQEAIFAKLNTKAFDPKVLDNIRNDSFNLPDDFRKQVEGNYFRPTSDSFPNVFTQDILPDSVRKKATDIATSMDHGPKIDPSKISIQTFLRLQMILPGQKGTIPLSGASVESLAANSLSNPLWEERITELEKNGVNKERIVSMSCLQLQDNEQCKIVLNSLKSKGIQKIYLRSRPNDEGRVKEIIDVAKEVKMPIFLIYTLEATNKEDSTLFSLATIKIPSTNPPSKIPKIEPFSLSNLSETPDGVAGIILENWGRFGYVENHDMPLINTTMGEEYGYDVASREAFLQKFAVDPIDINIIWRIGSMSIGLPSFNETREHADLQKQWWKDWKSARKQTFKKSTLLLLEQLSTKFSARNVPLYLSNAGLEQTGKAFWYSRWKSGDELPTLPSDLSQALTIHLSDFLVKKHSENIMNITNWLDPQDILSEHCLPGTNWSGVMDDWSSLSNQEIQKRIQKL